MQVPYSAIQPFCIKAHEYKIANTKSLSNSLLVYICSKNKSQIYTDIPRVYCKPTFILGDIISQFTSNKLFAMTNVGDQALSRPVFCYNNHKIKIGSRREIFTTMRLSRTTKISRT